jgi:hypothetical protein
MLSLRSERRIRSSDRRGSGVGLVSGGVEYRQLGRDLEVSLIGRRRLTLF